MDGTKVTWSIRPAGGYAHVLFAFTTNGQEGAFGPVNIRGNIVFEPKGLVPPIELIFTGLYGNGTFGQGSFPSKRHFVTEGNEVPTTGHGFSICGMPNQFIEVGVPWFAGVTTKGEEVTCKLCLRLLEKHAKAHAAALFVGDFAEIPEPV